MPAHSTAKATLSATVLALLLALAGTASAAAAPDVEDELPRRCEGAACARVATPVPWPDVRLEDGTVPFTVHGAFTLRLPKGALQFLLHDNGMTAVYPDRRWIGVQILTAKAIGLPGAGDGNTRPGALHLADMPRILYTRTPADPEPGHAEDRHLWRLALVFKNSHFENATQLQVAERGPLTAYFADWGAGSATGDIQVVHSAIQDAYLFVQLKGFSFEDVRRVVGSIETRRKQ